MRHKSLILIILLCTIIIFILLGVMQFDKVRNSKTTMESEYNNLNNLILQKAEISSSITSISKKYMIDKLDVIEELDLARLNLINADNLTTLQTSYRIFNEKLDNLIDESKNYKGLVSNSNYNNLKEELVNIDERVDNAINDYNNATSDYNIMLTKFPVSIIRDLCNLQTRLYFN